jgi:integrase
MALHRFETFTGYLDFRTFDREQAGEFKAYLTSLSSARSGSPLSAATIAATLRILKAFFSWLADQTNYRGKIRASDCQFLNPNANNARIASARRPSRAPALEDIRRVIMAMPSGSDIEKRDRALIAGAIISGARLAALASLKLKHLDLNARTIFQDAREVRTKARKTFESCFMPVGDDIREIIESYVGFLRTERGFGDGDPLFPKTAMRSDPLAGFVPDGLSREHWISGGPIRSIFREAFARAGVHYANPHSFRNTIVKRAYDMRLGLEELKALSQSLGHKSLVTTVSSYGEVPHHREVEIMRALAERKPVEPTEEIEGALRKLLAQIEASRAAQQ